MRPSIKTALRDSLVILPGYLVLGIGFGVLMDTKGFGLLHSFLMAVFIYAGSMQYVGVELLASAASYLTVFIMTIMVNIRHLFYGIGMLDKYKDLKKHKLYDIFALTDETFSIACNRKMSGLNKEDYYFYLSLFNHCYWIAGCVLGSILGDVLPFDFRGIEFSMTVLFIVIVIDQWEKNKDHTPVILSFIASIACLIYFGRDNFLIPSMALIIVILFIVRKVGHHA
ncbi:MAG: AzlC family ABC transporter permease [Erysipelotrichaceae bacterium]|nr:AzlC family ABC transporter permease [Erysipelotrichaceae bacterium]MEE3425484.1 AzlC family ABC transporter permease [Erysipelotrichaceae bacterium]